MMKAYKPGDAVVLAGPVTSGGRAQSMVGWEMFAALARVPDGQAPLPEPVPFACSWINAEMGFARLELAGAQTVELAPGHYQADVILRRTQDGFTTTTNTVQLEFVERVTPLPPPGEPAAPAS